MQRPWISLYFYRLWNIWANQRIVEDKLQNNSLKKYWRRLIALTYVIEAHRRERFPSHTDTYLPAVFDRRSARAIRQKVPPPVMQAARQ